MKLEDVMIKREAAGLFPLKDSFGLQTWLVPEVEEVWGEELLKPDTGEVQVWELGC